MIHIPFSIRLYAFSFFFFWFLGANRHRKICRPPFFPNTILYIFEIYRIRSPKPAHVTCIISADHTSAPPESARWPRPHSPPAHTTPAGDGSRRHDRARRSWRWDSACWRRRCRGPRPRSFCGAWVGYYYSCCCCCCSVRRGGKAGRSRRPLRHIRSHLSGR